MQKKRSSILSVSNLLFILGVAILVVVLTINMISEGGFNNIGSLENSEKKQKKKESKDEPILPSQLRWGEDFVFEKK